MPLTTTETYVGSRSKNHAWAAWHHVVGERTGKFDTFILYDRVRTPILSGFKLQALKKSSGNETNDIDRQYDNLNKYTLCQLKINFNFRK